MTLAGNGLSRVRVVRLSYVAGEVAVRRPGATEWAKALVNTPIQEGFEISTSSGGYAEVEFENGSTARLGEQSKIKFDELALDPDGNKVNRLSFEQGYATFHIMPEKFDSYVVKVAGASITPGNKSIFRTDLDDHHARVEVFNGSVEMAYASGSTVKLGKNKVAEFAPEAPQMALNTSTGITTDSWDNWVSKRDLQAQLALSSQSLEGSGSMYGLSDLGAYGEWGFFPGFGYGWSPFAGLGWSPFSMGMWSWYPGFGNTWISGEPWGWLPYHYGIWNYDPTFGWFWLPTGMGAYSPGAVNWYSGQGWVGWAPRGTATSGRIITASSSLVQNGKFITPKDVTFLPESAGAKISANSLHLGGAAALPGLAFAGTSQPPAGAHGSTVQHTAPLTILMNGNAANETSFGGRRSEVLRARMGTTLGGQYKVGGTVGEFRGSAFQGAGASSFPSGPQGSALFRGNAPSSGPVFNAQGPRGSAPAQVGGESHSAVGGGASSSVGGGGMSHGGGASAGGHR
jgi:hypothetical protein